MKIATIAAPAATLQRHASAVEDSQEFVAAELTVGAEE
jgi:hypothetical protein